MDGDKHITHEEVIKYLISIKPEERPNGLKDVNPWMTSKIKKVLKKTDSDGDGLLSFEEFEAFWKAHE